MLDALKKLFRSPSPPERHFGDDDARLALAALLVHCTGVDGTASDAETAKLKDVLARTFKLPDGDLQLLISDAIQAEREAVDLYRFTSVLKRGMSETDRVRVVEDLWDIVYADGKSHEFEENLVWRVAELLAVSRQDRIATKRAAAENLQPGEGNAG
jgi:uncharacterized tellurite resistance protein B-like protein